ncbi:MAG: hypothetical protein COV52_00255 [Gammaproteobacteria bacterium CG11_big_fil_rev_8_21_14_0_20_46_22]|nr:MAG: hypothetical protein COW05_09635 [Gammaproteobacteria bacterium CG12_big_fil_rev_8_21_14_0_65_46_12]PIR12148.1 MAG: hypothetical protein COV52_00255 [Gammaproteobacteria bacterium CG11_big_fil_rev_8_21_14_0_20_46_22]
MDKEQAYFSIIFSVKPCRAAAGQDRFGLFIGSFIGGRVSVRALKRHPLVSHLSGFLNRCYAGKTGLIDDFENIMTQAIKHFQSDNQTNALVIKRSILKKFIELCLGHPGLKKAYERFWQGQEGVNMFNQTAEAQEPLAHQYRQKLAPAACN